MNKQKIPRSFGTHDGAFHADEVTACALLLLFNCIDADKIMRTRDKEILSQCEYACDVGGVYDASKKLFDHHQADYTGNLSSAGMILSYLHEIGKLTKREYSFFNNALVLGVDAHDNGREIVPPGVCSYSHIITSFTPIVHEASPAALDQTFHQALSFSRSLLERMYQRYKYTQSCRQIVEEAMKKYKDCLIFDQNIPWQDSFFELEGANHSALFVIMPSDNHWKLRGIPPSEQHRMQVRLPLPQEWAGLLADDLKKVSGIPGAIFCHKGRFISVWETREDALKALKYVLNKVNL